jgi:hypothetical protein
MQEESRQSRGLGSFFFAAIPWVLAMAALAWLGFYTGIVEFHHQQKEIRKVETIEGRMDGRVGASADLSKYCTEMDNFRMDVLKMPVCGELYLALNGTYPPSWYSFKSAAAPTRDNGLGQCPAFTHYHDGYEEFLNSADSRVFGAVDNQMGYHAVLDGKCHDDVTDEPVADPDRRKLPRRTFHPDPNLNWL